jgi:hypothetical protein
MKEFLAVMTLLSAVATPAFAQISEHRAEAIERCQQQADAKWGPSGVRDWRRYDHNFYASCMADQGEPE